MRYRLMTHTQPFTEEGGANVVRQLALDQNDAAYWFTPERVAELQADSAHEVVRADELALSREPFAEPEPPVQPEPVPPPEFGPGGPAEPPPVDPPPA